MMKKTSFLMVYEIVSEISNLQAVKALKEW